MAVTKRTNAAAAGSAPPDASAPSSRRPQRPPVSAASGEDDSFFPPAYVHKNPALLLGGFAVAFAVVLYCAFVFWQLKSNQLAAKDLAARIGAVQSVEQRQEELNAHTRHKWDLYTEHRGNVTETLMFVLKSLEAQGNPEPSLAVLGAGNINDLDLANLVRATPEEMSEAAKDASPQPPPLRSVSFGFSSASLIDLDAASMTRALARHQTDHAFPSARIARLRMYQADLSGGSMETWDQWKKDKIIATEAAAADSAPPSKGSPALVPSVAAMEQWISQTLQLQPRGSSSPPLVRAKGLPAPPARFSAVVSLCLLSQLLGSYGSAVAESHPSFLRGALALREAHLRALIDLVEPAGWGIVITDIVASTTFDQLRHTPHSALPALLPNLVASSNFFTGCNPRAIEAQIKTTFGGDLVASSVRMLDAPWRWRIGGPEDKTFLVYAIVFQKKP